MGEKISQAIEQQAQEAAEHKLQHIISLYGDADGERNKPYYLAQLVEEAKTVIIWHMFGAAVMELDKIKAPVPTKATEAVATH
jgi:hypothetical protein